MFGKIPYYVMLNALRLNNGDLCIEWLVNIYETCYYVYMLGQD